MGVRQRDRHMIWTGMRLMKTVDGTVMAMWTVVEFEWESDNDEDSDRI